jgi:hypothetical protein
MIIMAVKNENINIIGTLGHISILKFSTVVFCAYCGEKQKL